MCKKDVDDFDLILNKIKVMAEAFKAMGDPNRLKIIGLLASKKGESFSVNDIAQLLEISQPATSQHLKNLKNIGIVNSDRKGFHVYYRIDIRRFKEIKADFDFLSEIALVPREDYYQEKNQ